MDSGDWAAIRSRLVLLEDGRLSHQRLELERVAVAEIREKRSHAGRMGGRPKANGKQNESKTKAPNPSPSLPSLENTHADFDNDFRRPGWAAEAWSKFVAVWNRTERASRWDPLTAPDGWVDHAATPGWLERAGQAMQRLPRCQFFANPLAVTQFFGMVDRILAGEFDNAKRTHGKPDEEAARRAALERKAREFAGLKPSEYRRPKELVGLTPELSIKKGDL
jgi:hypothetical protein